MSQQLLSDLNDLEQAEADSLSWEVSCVPITVAKSYLDDTSTIVNLIDTLEKGKNKPKTPDDHNAHWFPSHFCFSDISTMLVKACQQAGFLIRQKGVQKNAQPGAFKFICSHFRRFQAKVSACQCSLSMFIVNLTLQPQH